MKKNRFIAWLLIVSVFLSLFSTNLTPVLADGALTVVPQVETPAEVPVVPPTELPAEPPVEVPVVPPTETPVEPPIEIPGEPPVEKPIVPVESPAPKPLTGQVTVTVEKFTLGQGYVVEPIKAPIYQGDNGAAVLARALGEGNFKNGGSIEENFYLTGIKNSDARPVNIPTKIVDAISKDGSIGTKVDPNWLGASDYYKMSGWMASVNNAFLSVGMSAYFPKDGDVIRTQFTLYGYGADIGGGWDGNVITPANKDALTVAISDINVNPNKTALLLQKTIRVAYLHANEILANLESTQESIDAANVQLQAAISKANEPDKTAPEIVVEGLAAYQSVSANNIAFNVAVTDNIYDAVDTEVKLNGVSLEKTTGPYKVVLSEQDNLITVDAVDVAGNKATKSFFVLYYDIDPKGHLVKSLEYILQTSQNLQYGMEWTILALARSNYPVNPGYYDTYYNNVAEKVKENMVKNNGVLHKYNSTEHSRTILGLTAIGRDIKNVAGYDLSAALADHNYPSKQGINGSVFALLAMDSNKYTIPKAKEGITQTTRENLITNILDKELNKGTEKWGGWAFFGAKPDPDMTAMAIQSLTPYYNSNAEAKAAVDRGINLLSQLQNSNGDFVSYGVAASESAAQTIVALTGLGIDPHKDPRFVKNGKSALDSLLSFAVPSGGFIHALPKDAKAVKANGMSTDQGTYALNAYDRFINKKNRFYDMTDVPEKMPEKPTLINLPEGNKPEVTVPQDYKEYFIPIKLTDSAKDIAITIPSDKQSKVFLQLLDSNLPGIKAVKGQATIVIPKGTKIISGNNNNIELITNVDVADSSLRNKIRDLVPSNRNLNELVFGTRMGGTIKTEFSDFVTLTFAGMAGKEAAFLQSGKAQVIQKYGSDELGKASGKGEYAYDSGSDLIVKTKHFTDFIAYSTTAKDNGSTSPLPINQVTVSVDKLTINKGYTVSTTTVTLIPGDTAWSVLKRVLDSRNIVYDYRWYSNFNSVYVVSIAGDGELNHGSGSGWMYNVNGTYPNIGASLTELKNGDKIEWRYTKNMGEDLKANNGTGGTNSGGGASGTLAQEKLVELNGKLTVVDVPRDIQKDYTLRLSKRTTDIESVTINIPDVKAKVFLNLVDVVNDIPQLTINKGNLSARIEKGTKLTTKSNKLELFTAQEQGTTKWQEYIASSLASQNKFDRIQHGFVIGDAANPIKVDKPITVSIKDGKGQLSGTIANGAFLSIPTYETEAEGNTAAKGKERIAYAFVQGNDLIIKTNYVASFVIYTTKKTELQELYGDAATISDWAKLAVADATAKGIVQGNNGSFKPKSTITRAEFAKMLVSVVGLDTSKASNSSFSDVTVKDWYYPYVQAAAGAEYITGYNGKFNPNQNITREQMAVTVSRALKLQAISGQSGLKDIEDVSSWAKEAVESIVAKQLMVGSENNFEPQDVVTREMATVVALRAFDYKNKSGNKQVDPIADLKPAVDKQIKETAAYLQKTVKDPVIASIGGEWTVFSLARSNVPADEAYYAKYYANVERILKEKSGKLHSIKYTEYDRVILALTAIGKNVDNVAGYNLREPLADFDTLTKQGINGPIFALLALDSNKYEIPLVKDVKTQTTRELLIDFILNREIAGGGWALGEKAVNADPDITAMAIQALTPYHATNAKAKLAIEQGLNWLSKAQKADGSYASGDSINAESIAQVIVALTGLGIDPHRDARFVKNGKSAIDALLSFAAPGGGFYHIKKEGITNGGTKPGEVDIMATDQSMYALVAYERFLNGKSRLYDMTDVK
ncbi:S-layer homology domain-containing protein [Paenibacillus sp. L3-i20]|uniref:S-layer homology domain-containing protein n=1 Tax=Paenibacillus sp. L3-i20 TaxID=2905833 RepID=UPI001EE02ECD|nr:S-layer homology domain-containing protein [Paenibacillus sp. L3-i20]GKU76207.1 hypothetical protein L3i20_v206040 [Paenibacillus sp. L3-i20]